MCFLLAHPVVEIGGDATKLTPEDGLRWQGLTAKPYRRKRVASQILGDPVSGRCLDLLALDVGRTVRHHTPPPPHSGSSKAIAHKSAA